VAETLAARVERARQEVSPALLALGAVVAAGAILRFATLDLQSYRYDEAVTVGRILQPNLFHTLSAVPGSESVPPLYYFLAWFWAKLFGTGEVGLRSFSALAGTLTIPVVHMAARALGMRWRVGLIAAAIVAVNPVLIWFSQDARAYALTVLLTALSFLFFAKAMRQAGGRVLIGWAVASSLALASHYFAGFVVAPEAALLLWASRPRRQVVMACAGILVVIGLLLPIALEQKQNAHAGWIAKQPLSERLERAGAKLVGNDNGDEHGARETGRIPLLVPAALAVFALGLLLLAGPGERRAAGIAGIVAVAGVIAPLLLGALGSDYFDGRNMLPVFVPLIVLIAAGFGVQRAGALGLALAAAYCLCSLAFTIEIDRQPRLQREDLRNAAAQIGPPRRGLAVVTVKYSANQPLAYYLGARPATGTLPPLREIDLIGSASATVRAGRLLPPQFRQVESKPVSYNFTLTRYRSPRPVSVPLASLERGALVGRGSVASVLTWPSAGPSSSAPGGPVPAR
jgi:mannosyltransferase